MDSYSGQINLDPYAKGDRGGCVITGGGERGLNTICKKGALTVVCCAVFIWLSMTPGKLLNSQAMAASVLKATSKNQPVVEEGAPVRKVVSHPVTDRQKLDALIGSETPVALHRLSPYVVTDAFAYSLPGVQDLHQRLQIVERVAQGRRLPVRHSFQALYGSHFLRHNPVGNDLDYMLGIHLGAIRIKAELPEPAAEEIVARIEGYLQALDEVFMRFSTPELAVLQPSPLKDGHFRDRDVIVQRLSASLHDVARGLPHQLVVVERRGIRVPTMLSPEESYIFALTRIQFLSNRVQSVDWMYPGIRRAQMMFHFFCRLEIDTGPEAVRVIENLPLDPTFFPTGKLLNIQEHLLWGVPVDAPSADFFSRIALSESERMTEVRLDLARQFLGEVDHKLQIGETVKALKRLQQAREALFPTLDRQFVAELGAEVASALNNPDVLLFQQVAVMAGIAQYVFRDPSLLTLYRDSKDLQHTLAKIDQDLDLILFRHPEQRSPETETFKEQLAGLIALLDGPSYGISWKEADDLMDDIEDWGEASVMNFSPSAEQVAPRLKTIREVLQAAGVYALPIYGLPDDTVGVLVEDVERLGLKGDLSTAITSGGGPRFNYRGITPGELPRDRSGEPLPEAYRLWLFLERSEQEQYLGQTLRTALARDFDRFTRIPPLPSAGLVEKGHREFQQKFGSSGDRAWEASTTQGKGLLALLGVEKTDAERLLEAHLDLIARSSEAVKIMPPLTNGDNGFQVALERAIRSTSEGILEGLAVGRISDGRRGLDPSQAGRAQKQLSQLITALADLAQNRASVLRKEDVAPGAEVYRIRTQTGPGVLNLLIRPRTYRDGHPARIEFRLMEMKEKAVGESVILSLAPSARGGSYAVRFSSDRLDWGVHGGLPTDPMVPDHFYYDGMPVLFQAPAGDLARETMVQVFARYVKKRFLPEVIEDLPTSP